MSKSLRGILSVGLGDYVPWLSNKPSSATRGILVAPQLVPPAPTLKSNSPLSDAVEKYFLWKRAATIPGWDPAVWRKDRFGYWMRFEDYGTSSAFGWGKDHVVPEALGRSDALENLAATHYLNNRRKSPCVIG